MVVSVIEVKKRLKILASDQDATVQELIAEFESFARAECSNDFKDSAGSDSFPKCFVSLAVEYVGRKLEAKRLKGIQSESLGDHSVSYDPQSDFSDSFSRTL